MVPIRHSSCPIDRRRRSGLTLLLLLLLQLVLLFGVRLRLLLHIDQIRTAAGPGTARVAAVRIVVVVDAATAAAGNTGHLQNALGPADVGAAVGADHVQTAVAPVQVSNHFLHHRAVHLPAGIDLGKERRRSSCGVNCV